MSNVYCEICKLNSLNSQGISFHRIPLQWELAEKWMEVTGLRLDATHRICSKHFSDNQLRKKGLRRYIRKGAIPNLNLTCSENSLSTNNCGVTTDTLLNKLYDNTKENMIPNEPCVPNDDSKSQTLDKGMSQSKTDSTEPISKSQPVIIRVFLPDDDYDNPTEVITTFSKSDEGACNHEPPQENTNTNIQNHIKNQSNSATCLENDKNNSEDQNYSNDWSYYEVPIDSSMNKMKESEISNSNNNLNESNNKNPTSKRRKESFEENNDIPHNILDFPSTLDEFSMSHFVRTEYYDKFRELLEVQQSYTSNLEKELEDIQYKDESREEIFQDFNPKKKKL